MEKPASTATNTRGPAAGWGDRDFQFAAALAENHGIHSRRVIA